MAMRWVLLFPEMPSEQVDGMDAASVHEAVTRAAAHIRSGKGPYFLEIKTYRYKGHSVSDPAKYRTKDEVKQYQDIDPVKMSEKKLLADKLATAEEIKSIKEAIVNEIKEAVEFAEASSYPDASEFKRNKRKIGALNLTLLFFLR